VTTAQQAAEVLHTIVPELQLRLLSTLHQQKSREAVCGWDIAYTTA
jgi:hypothetical protein